MSDWINPRIVRFVLRSITSSFLAAFVGWNVYQYYKNKNISYIKTQNEGSQDELCNVKEELVKIEKNDTNIDDQDTSNESGGEVTSDSEYSDYTETENEDDETNQEDEKIVDIEDIGPGGDITRSNEDSNNIVRASRRTRRNKNVANSPRDFSQLREEQLTDKLRTDLSKQGYRLIQSHSAVKMCRWTKNSMRGRGGCYKHTFYGIKSYQCMEMTPNLACASKCTFCWRHHKNPVGTEWRWKMDAPDVIVEGALKQHEDMIKQCKGVPGVTPERFLEAQTVRHCALSLVGEPIFYPRINELLEILHARQISTFLVTNAQFPDAMQHLIPVTQLYVSIDAPNRELLKKIDRPLYKDFWERYLECLEILSEKRQRTVYRLTLVQEANMEDLNGYAELIRLGKPDFIEIKGVTYCGTSKANKLTMKNVPWHEQVVEFAKSLMMQLEMKETYELACEHSHSNCVLIANSKFKINGKWHTWINYEKYFQLIKGRQEFDSLDYVAETPSWAIFGSPESGFDPEHMRWIRKDHKLKLLKQRIANQPNLNCCSSETNCDSNSNRNTSAQPIELN